MSLSFVYQPGIGLFDKKKTADIDEPPIESDIDHGNSLSRPYNSYLKRRNQQESDGILLSDNKSSTVNLCTIDTSSNQENDQLPINKTNNLCTKEGNSKNLTCQTDLCVDDNNHNKMKLLIATKQSLTERILIVDRTCSETAQIRTAIDRKDEVSVPAQGLLLCPKDESIKSKKKKKIASTITSSTQSLDDDSIVDSILFNEMQSVQQQWQQFHILTMEKELHTNLSEGKKKSKINKFHRTNEFLSAYENLYDFEGMKHWYPVSR